MFKKSQDKDSPYLILHLWILIHCPVHSFCCLLCRLCLTLAYHFSVAGCSTDLFGGTAPSIRQAISTVPTHLRIWLIAELTKRTIAVGAASSSDTVGACCFGWNRLATHYYNFSFKTAIITGLLFTPQKVEIRLVGTWRVRYAIHFIGAYALYIASRTRDGSSKEREIHH